MRHSLTVIVLFAVFLPSAVSQQAPRGFREIRFGMSLDQAKEALARDPYFDYRGDPDVSFLPLSRQSLIECGGTAYISRAYFQFHEQRLYVITLLLDRSVLDHYSLFTTLTARYGPHTELSPSRIRWRFGDTDLALERPLTVKYIDRQVFDRLQQDGVGEVQLEELSRERFLGFF